MPLIEPAIGPLIGPARLSWRQRWRYIALTAWALLLLSTGQRAAALEIFGYMLQLRPASRHALASQAHVQMQLHQTDAAIATLQRLTAVMGPSAEQAIAWFNLGFVLQQADRMDAAGDAFEKALALDPRLDQAWYGLGLVRMAQRQLTAAIEAFEKNTCLQPLSPHGWYRLVQVWLALGETVKAARLLAHLRSFEPRVAAQLARENSELRRDQTSQPPSPGRSALTTELANWGARDFIP